jgi:hypothetical protein
VAEEEPEDPEVIELSDEELELELPPPVEDAAIREGTGDSSPRPDAGRRESERTLEEDVAEAKQEAEAQEESSAAVQWQWLGTGFAGTFLAACATWIFRGRVRQTHQAKVGDGRD